MRSGGSKSFYSNADIANPPLSTNGSSSISFQDGKKGRLRRGLQTVISIIIKEEASSKRGSPWLTFVLMVVDIIQLLSFALASELSPQLNLLNQVSQVFSAFRLQLALAGSSVSYFVLLYLSWIWVLASFGALYYVFRTCRQGNSVKYIFPFRFLRFSVGLCILVLYVPINQVLLFISDCDFSKQTHMYLDIQCFTTSHIVHMVISIFLLLVFTSFLLLMSLVYFEYKPGKSWSSRVHGRLDFIYLLAKFLLGIVLRICRQLEFARIWAASLLCCSFVLTFASLYFMPFYERSLNMLRSSCFTGFLWISICIFFKNVFFGQTDASLGFEIAVIAGTVLSVVLGAYSVIWATCRIEQKALKGQFSTVFSAEIAARRYHKIHIQADSIDEALLAVSSRAGRNSIMNGSGSADENAANLLLSRLDHSTGGVNSMPRSSLIGLIGNLGEFDGDVNDLSHKRSSNGLSPGAFKSSMTNSLISSFLNVSSSRNSPASNQQTPKLGDQQESDGESDSSSESDESEEEQAPPPPPRGSARKNGKNPQSAISPRSSAASASASPAVSQEKPTPLGKKGRRNTVEFSFSSADKNRPSERPLSSSQLSSYSEQFNKNGGDGDNNAIANGDDDENDILMQFIQHRRDKLDRRIKNSKIDLKSLRQMLACASLKFGSDPFLVLSQALHAELTFKDKDAAIKLLRSTTNHHNNNLNVEVESIPFDLEVIIQRFLSSISGEGGSSSDVISQLELARDLKVARQSHMRSLEALSNLFDVLDKQHEVSMPAIEAPLRELDRWERITSQAYSRLLYKSPNNTRVLRSFAAFMSDVKHNSGEADNLLRRADEIEEDSSRVNGGAMHSTASSMALAVSAASPGGGPASPSNMRTQAHAHSGVRTIPPNSGFAVSLGPLSSPRVMMAADQHQQQESQPRHPLQEDQMDDHQQQYQQNQQEQEQQEPERFYLQLPDGSVVETTAEIFKQLQDEEERSEASNRSSEAQQPPTPTPAAASAAARKVSFHHEDQDSEAQQEEHQQQQQQQQQLPQTPRLNKAALDALNATLPRQNSSRKQMVADALEPTTPRPLRSGSKSIGSDRSSPSLPPQINSIDIASVSSNTLERSESEVEQEQQKEDPIALANSQKMHRKQQQQQAFASKRMDSKTPGSGVTKRSESFNKHEESEEEKSSHSGSSRSSYSSVGGKLVKLRSLLEQRKDKTDSAPILRNLQLSLRAILFLTLALSCAALTQLLVDFSVLRQFFNIYIYESAFRSPFVLLMWHYTKTIVSLSTVNSYNAGLLSQFSSLIGDARTSIITTSNLFLNLQRQSWDYVRSIPDTEHHSLFTQAVLPTLISTIPPESSFSGNYDDFTFRTAPNITQLQSLLSMGQNYATAAKNIIIRNETKAGNMSIYFVLSNAASLSAAVDRSVEFFLKDSIAKAEGIQTTQTLFLVFGALLYICFGAFLFIYVLPKIKRYQVMSFETLVQVPSPVFRYLGQCTIKALEAERDDEEDAAAALLHSESVVDMKGGPAGARSGGSGDSSIDQIAIMTKISGNPRTLIHDTSSMFKSAVNRKLLGLLILLWCCFVVYFSIGIISSKSSKVASQDLFWPMRSQIVRTHATVREISYCDTYTWCNYAWAQLSDCRKNLLRLLDIYLYGGDGYEGILGRFTDMDAVLNDCLEPPCMIGTSGLTHSGYISMIHTYADYIDRILHVQDLLVILLNSPYITVVEDMYETIYKTTEQVLQMVIDHTDQNFSSYTLGFALIFASSLMLLLWVYSLVRRKVIAEIGLELHRINLCFLLLPHDVIAANPPIREFLLLRLKEIESLAS